MKRKGACNFEGIVIRKALVVIVAKYLEEKRVLVLRTNSDRGSFWQCPTGKVEGGESVEAGALREAEEETGLRFPSRPQFLGLRYQFEGRWGPAEESAFGLWIILTRREWPQVTIDANEHQDWKWLTPQEAMELVAYPMNKKAIAQAIQNPSPITLSGRGEFLQEGEEISHVRTRKLLLASMEKVNTKDWQVRVGKEVVPLFLQSTPFFISSFSQEEGTVTLTSGEELPLDLQTLEWSKEGALTASLKGERAAFLVGAYHRFAQLLEGGPLHYTIPWKGKLHSLRLPAKSEGVDL